MHRVTLLCVGSLKISWAKEGCADYLNRLKHGIDLNVIELPASKEKDPDRQRADESRRLLEALENVAGEVIVLDERGKNLSSQEFSALVGRSFDRGDSPVFVIGGAYGFTDEVRDRATRLLNLSTYTLPHELCRLVFLEQFYRATEIRRGSGYHH